MKDSHIKTRRIELFIDCDDKDKKKEYYKKLRDWEYCCTKASNIISSHIYVNQMGIKEFHYLTEEIKLKLDNQTKGGIYKTSKQNSTYQVLSKKFKGRVPSSILTSLNTSITKQITSKMGDIIKGSAAIPTYKRGLPIPFQAKNITKFEPIEKKYGKSNKKTYKFVLFGIPLVMNFGKDMSNNKNIVDKIWNGDYSLKDSSLMFRNKKLFLNAVVEMPKKNISLNEKNIIAVDLGVNCPITAVLHNNSKIRISIGSKDEFFNQRNTFYVRKRQLQKDLKFVIKSGHGRKSKLSKLDIWKEKEKNWRNTKNHQYSHELIKFALKQNAGIIVMENLMGFKKDEKNSIVLRNWSYYDLQQKIEYKANEHNIKVVYIDPRYTSQICNQCKHLHEENRDKKKGWSKFKCTSCGYEENADVNGAINVGNKYLFEEEYTQIIEDYLKSKEKQEPFLV